MKKNILHNKPSIGSEEAVAIKRVIKSGWVAEGEQVKKFEDEFSDFLFDKTSHAVAVSNGTSALFLALISLDVKPGDEIILPTYACTAVLNAVFMAGVLPVLVDIDEKSLNISFSGTVKKLNKKTKAIIITHTFGCPADLDEFLKLRVPIIEDCAQALGSKFNGKYLGTFGAISTFSFYASKVITTGNGGMVFSKNKKLLNIIRDYREFDCRKEYRPRFNIQMSDIQAAMGRVQLKKLPLFLKRRKAIAEEYKKIIPQSCLWPVDSKDKKNNFFRFLLRSDKILKVKQYFETKGIKTIIPIETRELLHRYLKIDKKGFPVSERISKTTLSLPIFPSLEISEISRIKSVLELFIICHKL